MKFAERLGRVKPSATLAVNAKAAELKEQGIKVISLALGEPDFNTPDFIGDAAKAAIDAHFTRYTAVSGITELRQGVCEYFRRVYGVQAKPENVIACNGGKHALFNLFLALLDPDDEIIIPAPYWTSYPDMAALVGAKPVIVPCSAEQGFRLSVADLEKARTPKSKVFLLNSPSNPTGIAYTQDELNTLVGWAVEHDIFVIADEIYDQLVYAPAKPASVAALWTKYPDKIAIANGLSKAFAMTGWRLGYVLGDSVLIKKLTTIQGQTTSNICSITQKAAAAALHGSYDCIDPMRDAFKRRRDYALAQIATWKGVVCPKPEGAFYLFPDMHALFTPEIPNATAMCTYLLEKAHVALVPGEAFGDPNCLRISYAVSDSELAEALQRIKDALYSK